MTTLNHTVVHPKERVRILLELCCTPEDTIERVLQAMDQHAELVVRSYFEGQIRTAMSYANAPIRIVSQPLMPRSEPMSAVRSEPLMHPQSRNLSSPILSPGPSPPIVSVIPTKRKQEDDDRDNLPSRKSIKTIVDPKEKLTAILSLDIPPKGTRLTGSARIWLNDVYYPVKHCLEEHFDGDHDAFVNAWKDEFSKRLSFFGKRCPGSREQCYGLHGNANMNLIQANDKLAERKSLSTPSEPSQVPDATHPKTVRSGSFGMSPISLSNDDFPSASTPTEYTAFFP